MSNPTPKEIAQQAWDNGHVPTFLKALCELLMCSDPWPASEECKTEVEAKVDCMARGLGFSDWTEAYHGLCGDEKVGPTQYRFPKGWKCSKCGCENRPNDTFCVDCRRHR